MRQSDKSKSKQNKNKQTKQKQQQQTNKQKKLSTVVPQLVTLDCSLTHVLQVPNTRLTIVDS